MGRMFTVSVALLCFGGAAWAQSNNNSNDTRQSSNFTEFKTTIGGEHPMLAAGARAIRAGLYDEGIELTLNGLENDAAPSRVRAAALSNLCAAHAARQEPDTAIEYCTESLELNSSNWRAFSNRSYAYVLKGDYFNATLDLDAAATIAPKARQVLQIRGMINEATLEPRVVIEEHQ